MHSVHCSPIENAAKYVQITASCRSKGECIQANVLKTKRVHRLQSISISLQVRILHSGPCLRNLVELQRMQQLMDCPVT